jgi:cysteine desulfurase
MIFLDAAATTPVRREVLEAMWPYLTGEFGNPSSHHSLGEAAATALAGARTATAKALNCRPAEVTFTSGGTEADNLAVKGLALARRAADPSLNRVVISAVEHPAVEESARYLEQFHGFVVDVVPVDGYGRVAPEALAAVLRPETALVSVMYANNEIGTIQPIRALAALAHERGIPFHTDAVQAAGWLPLDTKWLGVDAMSISGHKLGAPKGNGALFVRSRTKVVPLLHGGGQERGRRSGTENVAGAVALSTALALAQPGLPGTDDQPGLAPQEGPGQLGAGGQGPGQLGPGGQGPASWFSVMRDDFIREILAGVPGAVLTGHPIERLPSVASFCFPGTSGESVLLELERQGVVCSSGSACAAGSDAPSPVLVALGIDPELAQTAVRFSFDSSVTAAELGEAAAAVRNAVASVQALGRA